MVLHILRSKKFARKILLLLLVIIIPAFVLWGAGSVTNRPKPVGKIGTESISYEEFTESRQGMKVQVLFTYYGDFNTMTQIMKNRPMLNLMAWERLILLTSAKDAKMSIPDKEVLSFIAQHPLFQRTGKFDKEVYQYILTNTLSVTPRQFEELVRENMEIQALRQQLIGNLTISEKELKEHYKKLNDKVRFSYFLIGGGRFVKDVTVTDADAKKYYDSNKTKFVTPSKVEVEYIEFTYENVGEKSAVIRQIEKLYPNLTASPENMEALAKTAELNYGKTGTFTRDDVISGIPFFRSFHNTAFLLEEGEISAPVFSAPDKGSAYIMRKIQTVPSEQLEFSAVKDSIVSFLKERKSLDLAKEQAEATYWELVRGSLTLDQAAAKENAEIKSSGLIDSGGYLEGVGPARDTVMQALVVGQGKFTLPVIAKTGVILTRVDIVEPADEKGFEDNKEIFRENLIMRKQMETMEKWFKDKEPNVKIYRPIEEL